MTSLNAKESDKKNSLFRSRVAQHQEKSIILLIYTSINNKSRNQRHISKIKRTLIHLPSLISLLSDWVDFSSYSYVSCRLFGQYFSSMKRSYFYFKYALLPSAAGNCYYVFKWLILVVARPKDKYEYSKHRKKRIIIFP